MTQLSCKRGDTTSFLIRSRVVDLFAVDGLIYTVKTRFGDADTSAVLQKELAYGVEVLSSDTARVSLVHADTKPLDPAITYKWDLQAQQGGTVTTVDQGTLRVDADVTREVAVSISIIQVEPANPASLGAEVTARQSADLSLKTEISTSVSVEASARTSADASLSTALAAETSARVSTDTAHSNALALRVIKDAAGNTERLNTVNFTLDPVGVTHSEGVAHWSPDDHCLELGTDQAGVYLQVGQESLVRVRNVTGSTLLNGKVVYINGSTGQRPTVALADNTVSASATKTIGVMTADLAHNSDGYATTQGLVRDLNTSAFTDGATVYLGTAGNLTVTQPTAPNEIIRVGHVVKAHVTQGVLLVGVQHHQDAAEVPLSSIAGISATDVQGAVSELNSDITAETSARISGDASLSTRLSAEESTRAAVDATKANANNGTHTGTTNVQALVLDKGAGQQTDFWHRKNGESFWNAACEATTGDYVIGRFASNSFAGFSLRISNATGLATLSSLTVTGLATLNGGSLAGSGTAKAWAGSWVNDPAAAATWAHSAFSGNGNRYALRQNSVGDTFVNAASGQSVNFRIENANVGFFDSAGNFTALNSITNYAADVTVSALLALTPAQSAAKRKATVTGAYRMDGTLGRVEAWWDGDATAGTWVMRSGVAVTADLDAFMWSCAVRGINIPAVNTNGAAAVSFRSYPLPWRGLTSSAWAETSGGTAVTSIYQKRTFLLYTANDPTGYAVRNGTEAVDPRYSTAAYTVRASIQPIADANGAYYAYVGFAPQATGRLSSGPCAVALYDQLDTLALGITNGNIWLLTRTSAGIASLTDTGVAWQVNNTTPAAIQIVTTPTAVRLYREGVLLATHTTNLPDGIMRVSEGIVKTSGAQSRSFFAAGCHLTHMP